MVMMMEQLEVIVLPEFTIACVLLGIPFLIGLLQLAAILKLRKSQEPKEAK